MIELALLVPPDRVEPMSDALLERWQALAVSVEDADAGTEAEQPIFGEPGLAEPRPAWQRSTVRALFDTTACAEAAAAALLAASDGAPLQLQSLRPVAEQDWVRLTQSQFEPIAITPAFWIVPSWHEVPAGAQRVLRLDPGLAFGTGAHPTTRLCLRWIAGHVECAWQRVLDYGCGSGVLAIAAALHGGVDIDAVDIDPAALGATRDNAAANGVTLAVGSPDAARGAYDLVLANILATPLKLLAPLLAERVGTGGTLLLAGLLERQAEEVAAAYAPWIDLRVADGEDGWVLLAGRRGEPTPA